MELVEGQNLGQCLQKNQILNEETILNIFIQLLSAVNYCHSKKVLHRSFKLQNILLAQNLTVKLVDFGLSRYDECGSHHVWKFNVYGSRNISQSTI
jgi:serine/threonine protein kinase